MWLFTRDGFYSIVQHRDSADIVQVRARTREDLVDLAKAIGMPNTGNEETGIMEDPRADYRWRLNVPRETMAWYTSEAVKGIDYTTSVKTAIGKGDPKRKSALMRVWSAMMSLQRGSSIMPGRSSNDWFYDPVERSIDTGDIALFDDYGDRMGDDTIDSLGVVDIDDEYELVKVTDKGSEGYMVSVFDPFDNETDVAIYDNSDDAEILATTLRGVLESWADVQ